MHDVLGERFTIEADRGWREVYALVSEVMRRAGHGMARVGSSDR
jgi:hypothetical protein